MSLLTNVFNFLDKSIQVDRFITQGREYSKFQFAD